MRWVDWLPDDPLQRWLTTTICCLFRYHDERFIKLAISSLVMLASHPERKKPLSEYQLAYHPEMLRLEPVLSKIVHSNWIHIANSGIIGSDSECPRLPTEFSWACKRGHNIGSHKLALVLNQLCDPPKEVIFQSERLLSNLVLWLTWHFNGRLRIVVSGSVVYDKTLGQADSTVECRVSKFCTNGAGEGRCVPSGADPVPSFEMFESIGGDLKSLFKGQYDNQQTLMSEPRVRQKLYQSPFRYPKGAQKSLEIQTRRTAQELLKWFCSLPVEKEDMGSRLSFRLLLDANLDWSGLRLTDLLGRTPWLLNAYCGELGRPSVVFSPPRSSTPPTVDNFMELTDEDDEMQLDDEDDEDDEVGFEDQPRVLIKYFPILQDLVDQGRMACNCFRCSRDKGQPLLWDENCLRHKTFMEVMFYFSHGLADAFGAPDVSGCSEANAGDSGAMAILFDAIDMARIDPSNLQGKVDWHTLLSTTCQIFLGCAPLDTMTAATYNDSVADVPVPHMQHLGATIVAVQHGDLAVVAPWLDLSQRLDLRKCFRWEFIQGRLGVSVDDVSGRTLLQEVARDTSVIETQHTEDVSDYARMFKMPSHPAGADIQLGKDKSDETCDFILVSAGEKRYKLLMRVTSEAHSRMVDPSRAVIKMARGIHALQCNHGGSKIGSVPEGQAVELYRFDELLGRWGALEGKERDPEEEEDGPSLGIALPSQATSPAHQQEPDKNRKLPKPLRVTHVLDSLFKFNTALALSEDSPVFVDSGHTCLNCALEKAIGFGLQDFYKDYGRWIISHDPHPSNKVPRNRFQLTPSEARLLTHEKSSLV